MDKVDDFDFKPQVNKHRKDEDELDDKAEPVHKKLYEEHKARKQK